MKKVRTRYISEEVRKALNCFPVPQGPYISLKFILRALDIELVEYDERGPAIAISKGSGKYILVSKMNQDKRKRLLIAHALAHSILHSDAINVVNNVYYDSTKPLDIKKAEASLFAYSLLMSERSVRRAVSFYDDKLDYNEMASAFSVPVKAIRLRIKYLGLDYD